MRADEIETKWVRCTTCGQAMHPMQEDRFFFTCTNCCHGDFEPVEFVIDEDGDMVLALGYLPWVSSRDKTKVPNICDEVSEFLKGQADG